ncbi:unnamed protein product [Leuciscus chuanchicus]
MARPRQTSRKSFFQRPDATDDGESGTPEASDVQTAPPPPEKKQNRIKMKQRSRLAENKVGLDNLWNCSRPALFPPKLAWRKYLLRCEVLR